MRLAAALLLLCGTHALTATGPQPVAWSLAGSDSSAGAGVEADLCAFRCLGARGCAVVTALTAQSTTGVEAVLETPAAHVEATIAALEADLPPAAVKTGALGGAGAARAVAAFLRRAPPGCKVVVDPVVVSTSGRSLLDEAGEAVLVEEILPRAANGETVLIISSKNCLRALLMGVATHVPPEQMIDLDIPNCQPLVVSAHLPYRTLSSPNALTLKLTPRFARRSLTPPPVLSSC